jgi:hypothetical protein
MDATDQRFAYRCLPLNIANGHGWEILSPAGFEASWDGGEGKDAVQVRADLGEAAPALGHFGHGVLTFHVPCLFETSPGFDLFVTGPINRPKDGLSALTGVVETDWAPYTFTMNWVITRPFHRVRFDRGEPFCCIFPMARGLLEGVRPEQRALSASPELAARHQAWSDSRNAFNAGLAEGVPPRGEAWQKTYFRGQQPSGEPAAVDGHRSRLRLEPFTEGRPEHPAPDPPRRKP